MKTMDESRLLEGITYVLEDDGDRQRRAASIAGAIRSAGEIGPEMPKVRVLMPN